MYILESLGIIFGPNSEVSKVLKALGPSQHYRIEEFKGGPVNRVTEVCSSDLIYFLHPYGRRRLKSLGAILPRKSSDFRGGEGS